MGGHGGLNILPQKRWNVYNRDNKAKVEKDQQKQHEKNEQINKNLNEGQASARYEFLKRKKNSKNLENRTIQKSEINKELEDLTKSKHLNLFQNEEKINVIEANRNAKLEKEKKNLPYDETSKFLGVLDEKINKPWYIDLKEKRPESKKINFKNEKIPEKEKEYYKIMKDFQVDSNTYFKVIGECFMNSKKDQKIKEQEGKNDNNEEKNTKNKNEKKDKEIPPKHHKEHKRSRSRGHSKDKEKKEEKLAKLREERLKREQNEKKKVIELIKKNND